ncbi:MAG: ParB/RepB/Spo0J family partition protein [Candidatus Uhrbacteria bacterium]|nr:ParB/RepB/Spo0J family partition protein [Candidatus Uhrbacteria bacterium]
MAILRSSGLGRGLGAIIPPRPLSSVPMPVISHSSSDGQASESGETRILQVSLEAIEKNPHQPRVHFDHTQLEDLISSIQEHGVIQPLIVSPLSGGRYQLIAGERRLRAASIAGLSTVPVILRSASEQEKLELAIIENVQRQDLNPLEEARAYVRLMEEFGLTQDDVSKKMGKSRPQVANTVRLLQLPSNIQDALMQGKISTSNARTLLSLPTDAERQKLFQAMLAGNFTVRETEARVYGRRSPSTKDANVAAAENRLREKYHCRVHIKHQLNGTGEIKLQFSSDEEFAELMKKMIESNS